MVSSPALNRLLGRSDDSDNLAGLKAKLAARENQPGFEVNAAELKKRIAELEGR